MEAGLLKSLGQALGIGGVALGVFFLLFREMVRKSIFPKLDKMYAYRLLRLITISIWSVAVLGVGVWIVGNRNLSSRPSSSISTSGPQSPVVTGTKGDVQIQFNKSPADAPR
jgi:hypothetical protein